MNQMLRNEMGTLELGAKLFRSMKQELKIYLHGELGTGKTTLVRGFLTAAGFSGPVKSPTFTLVEEYSLAHWRVVHFDLYRLADPEELEWIGIRDYFEAPSVCFIEWPERGGVLLPKPDLNIFLSQDGLARLARLDPESFAGMQLVQSLD
ncbi:MAG: tRNA (adenosine(37)-N6)-threonylcarbamoyltransferase complex ATPase subunit type 1 TsaE [Methylococcales bacterium]